MMVNMLAAFSVLILQGAVPIETGRDIDAILSEGKLLQTEGRFEESRVQLIKAIALLQSQQPARKHDLFDARNSLATAYRRVGFPEKSVELLEPLVKEIEPWKDPRAKTLLRICLNNLGTAYRFSNRIKDARKTFERSLQLSDSTKPDIDTAISLDSLANILLNSDLDSAAQYARRGNEIWSSLHGTESLDFAISLSVLGAVELRRKNPVAARKLLTRSLNLQSKLLGPLHPDLGAVHNILGVVELMAENKNAARQHFTQSLALSEKKLSADHPQIVEARQGLQLASE